MGDQYEYIFGTWYFVICIAPGGAGTRGLFAENAPYHCKRSPGRSLQFIVNKAQLPWGHLLTLSLHSQQTIIQTIPGGVSYHIKFKFDHFIFAFGERITVPDTPGKGVVDD